MRCIKRYYTVVTPVITIVLHRHVTDGPNAALSHKSFLNISLYSFVNVYMDATTLSSHLTICEKKYFDKCFFPFFWSLEWVVVHVHNLYICWHHRFLHLASRVKYPEELSLDNRCIIAEKTELTTSSRTFFCVRWCMYHTCVYCPPFCSRISSNKSTLCMYTDMVCWNNHQER